jgi:TPR repeat protein
VLKAEELLDRGDVSGARLLFRRAAETGDARAALGLARTFDAKVLRTLRVYGVRPDPDQAALWYARSKTLENLASMR